MPDTTIFKDPTNGWYDRDEPNKFYPVRRDARSARRLRANGQLVSSTQQTSGRHTNTASVGSRTAPVGAGFAGLTAQVDSGKQLPIRRSHTVVGLKSNVTGLSSGQVVLTDLQQKLFDRLTNKQGVSINDATDVIMTNGYNKAASYGHMRKAGATHAEAAIVISLGEPDVSVTYGKGRAAKLNHTDALAKALKTNVSNG